MSDATDDVRGDGPSHRTVEIGVGVFVALFGLIAIVGGIQVGQGWGAEGPQAGFFPFYVGLIIVVSSAVNVVRAAGLPSGEVFAGWGQLRQVAAVLAPTAVYVFLIPVLGIYVASAVLIAVFMTWFGRYRWTIAGAIALIVPILTFFMFEIWFLVPLPKGPLERALGF